MTFRCPRCGTTVSGGVSGIWICRCVPVGIIMMLYEDVTDCGDFRIRVVTELP